MCISKPPKETWEKPRKRGWITAWDQGPERQQKAGSTGLFLSGWNRDRILQNKKCMASSFGIWSGKKSACAFSQADFFTADGAVHYAWMTVNSEWRAAVLSEPAHRSKSAASCT